MSKKIDEKEELKEQAKGGLLNVGFSSVGEDIADDFKDIQYDEELASENPFRVGDQVKLRKLNRRLKKITGANTEVVGKVTAVFDKRNLEVTFLDTSPMRFPVKSREIDLVKAVKTKYKIVSTLRNLKHKFRRK